MDAIALMDRIMNKVIIADSGCWEWQGCVQKPGYGRIGVPGNGTQYTHRVLFTLMLGEIPAGLKLDHGCRNTICCNPLHLEPVTHRVNVLRGASYCAERASATHCVNWHEFTPQNTYITKAGRRQCVTCRKIRNDNRPRKKQLL